MMKPYFQTDLLTLYLADCLPAMREMPDKAFDLAIVDPPYGVGDRLVVGGGTGKMARLTKWRDDYDRTKWDTAPQIGYFTDLFRVSGNQIIWGGNYFDLPPTRGIVCWDKQQPWPNFSAWEMAWTSFDSPAKIFKYTKGQETAIHPTQKPVALYRWLLTNYAKPGDQILDTHLGSGSIAIACIDLGFHLTGYEIDEEYLSGAVKRIERYLQQPKLFTVKHEQPKQESFL